MTHTTNESIIHFVRDTLGCNCPDDVFKQIEFNRPSSTDEGPHVKIVVGGRLLIYIYELEDDGAMSEAALESLATRGIYERDSSGLNRFRLVIATADPAKTLKDISSLFETLRGGDEKAHLHVINIHVPALVPLLM